MRYFLLMIEVVPGVAVAVAQEPRPAREVKQLHIQRGHESMGPFSLEETTQHLSEGRLLETDLAWHEGLEENGSPPGQLDHELLVQGKHWWPRELSVMVWIRFI